MVPPAYMFDEWLATEGLEAEAAADIDGRHDELWDEFCAFADNERGEP